MIKAKKAMTSCGNHPMDGKLQVVELMLGRYEKVKIGRSCDARKKAVTALRFTEKGKVGRMYAMRIKDFSARSPQYIFVKNIGRKAKMTIDNRKGYKPIAKAYDITSVDSVKEARFNACT